MSTRYDEGDDEEEYQEEEEVQISIPARSKRGVDSSYSEFDPAEADAILGGSVLEGFSQGLSDLHTHEYSPAGADEIEIPGSVWEAPNQVRVDPERKFWECLHCNKEFRGPPNATKAKAHLAKAKMGEIKACTGRIPVKLQDMYKRQWGEYESKRESKKRKTQSDESLHEGRVTRGVAAMAATGKSYQARRFRKSSIGSGSAITVNSQSHSQAATKKTGGGSIQTYMTDNNPASASNSLQMDWAISSFIIEGGRSYNTIDNPHFKKILKLARVVPLNYRPPSRQKIGGEMLKHIYDERYKDNLKSLCREAEIFGLVIYGDGATIAKTPYFNVLASGVHLPSACLEIHDCSPQMASGGRKSGEYIAGFIMVHMKKLDPKRNIIDMVIFDGASNVQKAGNLIEKEYPMVTVVHGAEHVVSLFFSDVAKTDIGKLLVKFYSLLYKWFGGSKHSCYSIFISTSERIVGKKVGLIRPAGTRMGGYPIVWTRAFRLKPVFVAMIADPNFKNLKKDQAPPEELVSVLNDEMFWRYIVKFLHAMYSPLRLLRLCDTRSPCMDKLHYFSLMTTEGLLEAKTFLNCWDALSNVENELFHRQFLHKMQHLVATRKKEKAIQKATAIKKKTKKKIIDSDTDDDDDDDSSLGEEEAPEDSDDNDDNQSVESTMGLGEQILKIWEKRKPKLEHDYAIAAWLLSPCRQIQTQVNAKLKGTHKDSANNLLKKLFVNVTVVPSKANAEFVKISEIFWEEWSGFNRREGDIFDEEKACWLSPLIHTNETWKWHLLYTYRETEWLGKLACRVTSKITGIGSAERNWGDVKHLKSGKRIAMSSASLNMQTTVYGSACVEKARRKLKSAEEMHFNMWEDVDMDNLGLDRFGIQVEIKLTDSDKGSDKGSGSDDDDDKSYKSVVSVRPKSYERAASIKEEAPPRRKGRGAGKRVFLCTFEEEWEAHCVKTKCQKSEDRLLKKYGGIWFWDGDEYFTLDASQILWYDNPPKYMLNGVKAGYNADATKKANKGKCKPFDIDNDLLGAIWTSHFERRFENGKDGSMENKDFIIVPLDDDSDIHPDTGKWLKWMGEDNDKSSKPKARNKKN